MRVGFPTLQFHIVTSVEHESPARVCPCAIRWVDGVIILAGFCFVIVQRDRVESIAIRPKEVGGAAGQTKRYPELPSAPPIVTTTVHSSAPVISWAISTTGTAAGIAILIDYA